MQKHHFISILLTAAFILGACTPKTLVTPPDVNATSAPADAAVPDYTGKKILYVNSYHEGYPWSDGIESGLHQVLDSTSVELKIVRLDTKRNPDVAFGESAGAQAWAEIQAYKPDVIITSDDNSQKYLVVPYLRDANYPVVFNGVNWDASAYGYSTSNVTGMIEVELPNQLIDLLKGYSKGERLGYLTIDTETERKVFDIYNQRFFHGKLQGYWVKTQDEFKTAFLSAQQEVDILFVGNNAGSDRWDESEMKQFFAAHTKVPTGSINDWMAPYVLLTLAKSAEEQGVWSAQTALQILDGTRVSEIPLAENKKGQLMVNLALAEKLGVVFAPSILKVATILD